MFRLITTRLLYRTIPSFTPIFCFSFQKHKKTGAKEYGKKQFKPSVDNVLDLNSTNQIKTGMNKGRIQNRRHKIVINWDKLLELSDEDVKKLIFFTQKDAREQNKISMQLKIMIHNIIAYKPVTGIFDYIILLAALHQNQNAYLRDQKVKTLHIISSPLVVKDKSVNENLQEEVQKPDQMPDYNPQFSYEHPQLDENLLMVLAVEFQNTLKTMNYEKNKSNKFKFTFIKILAANIDKIQSFTVLHDLINILTNIANKSLILQYFRFSRLSQSFQSKILAIFKSDPQRYTKNLKLFEKDPNKGSLIFFNSFLKMIEHFGFRDRQTEQYIMKCICAQDFMHPSINNQTKIRTYLTHYRMTMEHSYRSDFATNNPILNRIQKLYIEDPSFHQQFQNYTSSYLALTFGYIIKAAFHQSYLKLKSQQIQGSIIISELSQKPVLSEFQWQFLDLSHQHVFSFSSMICHIIKKIYPERISSTMQVPTIEKQSEPLYNIFLDNEPVLRLKQIFTQMNIPYKKQVKIMGKKVDFYLPEENIIVQFDGDHHINYKTMNTSLQTGMRNYCFLAGGYKMIIFNVFQFNHNRMKEEMKTLLIKKMDLMKQNNAILVQ